VRILETVPKSRDEVVGIAVEPYHQRLMNPKIPSGRATGRWPGGCPSRTRRAGGSSARFRRPGPARDADLGSE
jgi:hypothetical protein